MNCLCNLFNDDCLWIIILIILVLMLACGNCSCGGSSRNSGCGCYVLAFKRIYKINRKLMYRGKA